MTKINKNISLREKKAFVDMVVAETYHYITKPDYLNSDVAFTVYFMDMFTDFDMPMIEVGDEEIVDRLATYEAVSNNREYADILHGSFASEMRMLINRQIEFENAKLIAYAGCSSANDEAIDAVAAVAYKLLSAADKLCDILDSGKDLIEQGKADIIKKMGSKKAKEFFDFLKDQVTALTADSDAQEVVLPTAGPQLL